MFVHLINMWHDLKHKTNGRTHHLINMWHDFKHKTNGRTHHPVQTEIVFVFYKFLKQKISYTILLDKKSDDIFSIRSIHMSSNKISTNTRTADTSSSQRSEIWNRKKFTKKWNSIKSLKSLKFSFWYLRSSYFHQRIFDMKFVVLWISSVNKTTCSCSWETVVFQRWRNVKLLYKDDAKKAKSELYFF